MKYNFHTHSHYDDGRMALEDFVIEAIDQGFEALGFSGHSPLPGDNEYSIKTAALPEYVAIGKRLKQQYKDQIRLYLGLEIEYIPGVSEDFNEFIKGIPLDYSIGSVHLVSHPTKKEIWFIDGPEQNYVTGLKEIFDGDARKAVTAYYEQSIRMVETQPMDIIGHLDKVKMYNRGRYFDTDEGWYQLLVERLLDAIKEHDVIVEVNTRGVYTGKSDEYFPCGSILEKCLQRRIPVMVNSDAHQPDQLSNHVAQAEALLRDIGYREVRTPFATYPL